MGPTKEDRLAAVCCLAATAGALPFDGARRQRFLLAVFFLLPAEHGFARTPVDRRHKKIGNEDTEGPSQEDGSKNKQHDKPWREVKVDHEIK